MELTIQRELGKARPAVRPYRKAPGSLDAAVGAAAHYAKRLDERVVVVEGNSYGCRVYHIAREGDSLAKYTAMPGERLVAVVYPDGSVYLATAR